MKFSTRLGLVGIGALGALSLVHWVRDRQFDGPDLYHYMLGVLPNVAAAIAITFVTSSIWADQRQGATWSAAHRCFLAVSLLAGTGLIAWEFIQQSSRTLVFDVHDIWATVVGLAVGYALFLLVTPRFSDGVHF